MFTYLTPADIATFAGIWLAAALSPGANVAFTISVSSRFGFWAGLIGACGFLTALLGYLILVAFGLGFAIEQYAPILSILRWFGVAYLLFLAWKIWHAPTDVRLDGSFAEVSRIKVYSQAALICLTNPKAPIFAAVVLPQTINPEGPLTLQMIILCFVGVVTSQLVHSGYSYLGSTLGRSVPSPGARRIINRVIAGVFVIAALGLGVSKLT